MDCQAKRDQLERVGHQERMASMVYKENLVRWVRKEILDLRVPRDRLAPKENKVFRDHKVNVGRKVLRENVGQTD